MVEEGGKEEHETELRIIASRKRRNEGKVEEQGDGTRNEGKDTR